MSGATIAVVYEASVDGEAALVVQAEGPENLGIATVVCLQAIVEHTAFAPEVRQAARAFIDAFGKSAGKSSVDLPPMEVYQSPRGRG